MYCVDVYVLRMYVLCCVYVVRVCGACMWCVCGACMWCVYVCRVYALRVCGACMCCVPVWCVFCVYRVLRVSCFACMWCVFMCIVFCVYVSPCFVCMYYCVPVYVLCLCNQQINRYTTTIDLRTQVQIVVYKDLFKDQNTSSHIVLKARFKGFRLEEMKCIMRNAFELKPETNIECWIQRNVNDGTNVFYNY